MQIIKKICLKILYPHIIIAVPIVGIGFGMVIYSLATNPGVLSLFDYSAYFLSAYALVVLCVRIPAICKWCKRTKEENKYIKRYTSEVGLRVKVSLYSAVTINGLYALLQLILGIYNHSVWFYSLAGYYVLLIIMRFFLLKEMRKNRWGENRFHELLLYRFCGLLLVVMNVAFAIVVFYIVRQNKGFHHHYIITISMAAYTFTSFTRGIINMVKYRKYKSPVLSATKVHGGGYDFHAFLRNCHDFVIWR